MAAPDRYDARVQRLVHTCPCAYLVKTPLAPCFHIHSCMVVMYPLAQTATEAQAPLLKKLADNSGGKLKDKAIKKSLDLILKKKTALDKDVAEYIQKGGADYLAKKKAELAAALA